MSVLRHALSLRRRELPLSGPSSRFRRRTLLATIAAGSLAGCFEIDTPDSGTIVVYQPAAIPEGAIVHDYEGLDLEPYDPVVEAFERAAERRDPDWDGDTTEPLAEATVEGDTYRDVREYLFTLDTAPSGDLAHGWAIRYPDGHVYYVTIESN